MLRAIWMPPCYLIGSEGLKLLPGRSIRIRLPSDCPAAFQCLDPRAQAARFLGTALLHGGGGLPSLSRVGALDRVGVRAFGDVRVSISRNPRGRNPNRHLQTPQ